MNLILQLRGGRRSQCIVPPPNKIMPPEGERKIRLWCYGKNSFIPYNASRRIGVIIRDHYSGPYPNWTNTPNDQVKVWWELFRNPGMGKIASPDLTWLRNEGKPQAKDLGREPQIDEVFKRTHKRKDDTFVNGRARDTMAKYHEGMSSQPQMTPLEVWAEAAGGIKRGKLYGLGSESSVVCGALVAPHLVIESTQRRNAADDDLRQQVVAISDEITQMKKKITEMENKESSTGHASAKEIAALVFAKMSSFFPSSH